jgi:hypothetical protein
MRKSTKALISACFALPLLAAANAQATTYFFTDGTIASGSFNNTSGVLTLTNLLENPTDVVGAISGFVITFETSTSSPALLSQVSASGNMVEFTKDKDVISHSIYAGTPINWELSGGGSAILTLNANHSCNVGGGAPCDLIIGPPGDSYSNANGSIESHSPFIYQTGVFTLSGLTGLIVDTVQFRYGTGPTNGSILTPTCSPTGGECALDTVVPLPGAVVLMGTVLAGGFGVGAMRRRRQQKTA